MLPPQATAKEETLTWNQCLSQNAITNYVKSLKYKLRQKLSNTNYVKISNTNYVKSLKYKVLQNSQTQTTLKVSNTNYFKSLKHKLC